MLEELLCWWIFEELNIPDGITKLYQNVHTCVSFSRKLRLQLPFVQFSYLNYLLHVDFSYILEGENIDRAEENGEKMAKVVDENISDMLETICTTDFQIKYGYKPQELKFILKYYNIITHEADLKMLHNVIELKDENKQATLDESNVLYTDWERAKVYRQKKSYLYVSNLLNKMRYCQNVLLYDDVSKFYAREVLLRYIETLVHTCTTELGYIGSSATITDDRVTRNKELSSLLPQEYLDIFA